MLASRISVARTFLQARAVRPCTSRALSVSAMAAAYPKLKLVYFNIKARAEPTRLALHIAGIPFEDKRIAHEEWPALKATMPLGQIPVSSAQPSAASAAASGVAAARSASRLHGLRDVTNPRAPPARFSRSMASRWPRATPSLCTRVVSQSLCRRMRSRLRRCDHDRSAAPCHQGVTAS